MKKIIVKSVGLIQTLNRKGPIAIPIKLTDSKIRKILEEGGHTDSVYEVSSKGVKTKITLDALSDPVIPVKEEVKVPNKDHDKNKHNKNKHNKNKHNKNNNEPNQENKDKKENDNKEEDKK